MSSKPLERSLLASAVRRLKELRAADHTFTWRKRHGSVLGVAGDPDLYGLWDGCPWEIELKRPGEYPTPLQSARLAEWETAGARVYVVHSMAELEETLENLRMHRYEGRI